MLSGPLSDQMKHLVPDYASRIPHNDTDHGDIAFADMVDWTQRLARILDEEDPLRKVRSQFIIPSKADLKRTSAPSSLGDDNDEPSTYLCGNSLGLQPRVVSEYVAAQLNRWASKGVLGHFREVEDSPIPPWVHMDDAVKGETAKIVGAWPSEVALMGTLTANLHLLLASFYRPTRHRYKILIEDKAFPSDHFAVESQILHHGYHPNGAMILIQPPDQSSPLLPTSHVLSAIDMHADTAALLLLPGIQYYTGQFLDIKTITAYAKSKGIIVGWDLAHAIGNVPLYLHDWDVDFAVWCTYKYLNCGPGAIGGIFVHNSRTADVLADAPPDSATSNSTNHSHLPRPYPRRLTGWWGSSKASRFEMDNYFEPIPGASGFQVSNPSALDLSAVLASLSVFAQTSMSALRAKSTKLSDLLEILLLPEGCFGRYATGTPYEIISPAEPSERGAQLSIRLAPGLLSHVMHSLEDAGIVVDERKPDVVRVAPAPLYNSFEDARRFAEVFVLAVNAALEARNAAPAADHDGMEIGNGDAGSGSAQNSAQNSAPPEEQPAAPSERSDHEMADGGAETQTQPEPERDPDDGNVDGEQKAAEAEGENEEAR